MRRWMIYAFAVMLLLILRPKGASDVAELLPVELLYVKEEAGNILVETDTGNYGSGEDLQHALEDLKASAPGKIFLETADYLIVTQETVNLLGELFGLLRPATEVCIGVDVDTQAADYLKSHPLKVTMKEIRSGNPKLPVLKGKEGRYWLE